MVSIQNQATALSRGADRQPSFSLLQTAAHMGEAPLRRGAGRVRPEWNIGADHFKETLRRWLASASAGHLRRDSVLENKRPDLCIAHMAIDSPEDRG